MIGLIIGALVLGACAAVGILLAVQKSTARSQAATIIDEANKEADVIMKNKILEAREQELRIISKAEKDATQRMQRVQNEETKIKQRQTQLNQQQSENARARNEIEQQRRNLEADVVRLEDDRRQVAALERTARESLEHISGMSSEEAKEKLVESLRDEAKTQAAAYIHDIKVSVFLTYPIP
ncbi:MAG: Rnase Y domain-containing protein, partial [Duncaniella sp.]|nr:Rnase Y domain-containing protein [Duncaniella sp.]